MFNVGADGHAHLVVGKVREEDSAAAITQYLAVVDNLWQGFYRPIRIAPDAVPPQAAGALD